MTTQIETPETQTRIFHQIGATIHVRLIAGETEGTYSLIEMHLPPGFPGAPRHYHQVLRERFVVLEGSLEVTLGDTTQTLHPGESAEALPREWHSFRNATDKPARMLLLVTPAGHERFFFELMDWMQREPVWPPSDRNALLEFGRRHDSHYA